MATYDFITQPFRYATAFDSGVRNQYALARQVEIEGRHTNLADAEVTADILFGILKAQRYRFNVTVLGVDVIDPSAFDGTPPCATLFSDRFNLQSGRLVLVPDFLIDPNQGHTILRCWG